MQAIRRLLVFLLAVAGAGPASAAQVRLFAAASLADALGVIVPAFERESGHTVQLNLGGSGLLARQITEGAPADVFFSADRARVAQLERAGLVRPGDSRVLLANQLVLIVPVQGGGAAVDFKTLGTPDVHRLALGEPATVPAGAYARAYLERIGQWSDVAAKVVPLDNVRAVLAAVAAGNADAGMVYRTDAVIEPRVRIAAVVPVDEEPHVVYPAVVLKGAADPAAARALLDYLAGDAAQAVFARFGFLPPPR